MNILKLLQQTSQPLNFWSICIIMTLVLMPPIGSFGSIVIFIMSVVAWKTWFSDKDAIVLTRTEKLTMAIVCFYFFTALFCSAIKADKITDISIALNNLGLIVGLSLLPLLRVNTDKYWPDMIVESVAVAGIALTVATLAVSLIQTSDLELLSGNSLILAYLAGLNAVFGISFFLNHRKYTWLSLLGAAGSIFTLIMTGRRGPLLAVAIALLPILVMSLRHQFRNISILMVCLALILGSAVLIRGQSVVEILRISQAVERLADPMNANIASRSLYLRFTMYQDSWKAFVQSPLLGYGRQNLSRAVAANSSQKNPEYAKHGFTHLHNAVVTEAVASGILGIIGLLGMYLVPILITWRGSMATRLLGIGHSTYFVIYGLSNIGFYHDVTVFSYIFIIALLNSIVANESSS